MICVKFYVHLLLLYSIISLISVGCTVQEYAMQLYMRQVWYDSRLKFNKTDWGRSTFSMNWFFAAKIWKPDTFFINGKKSYAHAITAPNMFVRLQHDGQIYMSMRYVFVKIWYMSFVRLVIK